MAHGAARVPAAETSNAEVVEGLVSPPGVAEVAVQLVSAQEAVEVVVLLAAAAEAAAVAGDQTSPSNTMLSFWDVLPMASASIGSATTEVTGHMSA